MNIIRGIHNIKEMNSGSVITIGNFDGIHLGHQKIFSYIKKIGHKYKIPTIIILFEPQPLEFLKKHNAPFRITTFRQKIERIAYYNINKVLCIKFNDSFQSLSAEDFIINILINKLHVKFLIIGYDFKFGFKRIGDFNLLEKFQQKNKFKVIRIKSLYKNNIKISSTNIRIALSQNKIKLASLLLGRSFSISGKVIHGNAIGRTIGYPTANISLKKDFLLLNGVYAVKIRYLQDQICMGICNIGIKKNFFNNKKNRILEVHLFDKEINLYNQYIEVFMHKKIRNTKIFITQKELQDQIYQDIIIVKKYFQIYK